MIKYSFKRFGSNVGNESNSEVGGRNREVRFTPESRLNSNIGPCLKSAMSRPANLYNQRRGNGQTLNGSGAGRFHKQCAAHRPPGPDLIAVGFERRNHRRDRRHRVVPGE